jgi:hypothetical protein
VSCGAVAILLLFGGLKRETNKVQKGNLVTVLAYACLFVILMTVGAKKFDRYMLPVILALDIMAAWGLVELARLEVGSWKLEIGHWSLVIGHWFIALFLLQAGHIISYHPYYLAYYNPLLGGLSRAVRVLPVGWGEGMDLAARYLNQKEDATDLRVATQGIPGFAPLFKGQTEGLTEHNLATADYAVLYVSDVQQAWAGSAEPDSSGTVAVYSQQEPEHVVNIHGVDYAWIYPNTHYQELIAYLESQAQPNDIVLLDANSPFVRYYQGPLPYRVILDSQSWTEMVNRLTESAGPQGLWYVAYPGSDMGSWISYQLSTHALLIDQEALPHATITHYLLTSPGALESSPIEVESNVNFGNRLRLTGYGFSDDAIEYRKQLGVTLRWRTQRRMEENYAFSLRLVDSEGHFWAQVDEWLLNPSGFPTSAWEAGETSEARYLLPIPPGVPSGRYLVKATVYQTDTLEEMAILDEGGRLVGMEYTLGTISITSPTVPPTIEELAIPHQLHHDFGGQVELLGYGLSAPKVGSGNAIGLTLFWQALRSMERDYRLHLQVQDDEGNIWAEGEFPLANEGYPTSRWNEDEVIRGQYDLVIDAAAPTGEFSLLANLLDEANGLPVEREGVNLTRLSVVAPQRDFIMPAEIQHPLRANLVDKVAFLGYDLDKATVRPGDTLHLTLYWQALAKMETSYTVFAHLLDVQNRIWGQKDNFPVEGTYPTTNWLSGEVVIDEYGIVVDAEAPAGEYQIEVGMYDPKSMSRLPAFDEAGRRLPDDRMLLESLIIVESGTK